MPAHPPDSGPDILSAVAAFMERETGGRSGRGVLAAVSGGADSVALLWALHAWSRRTGAGLSAVHVNHRLRGARSDADERFVRALCARLGVGLRVGRIAVASRRRPGESPEMAARTARLDVFRKTAAATGRDILVLGHHRDDRGETLFMRLCEGAGMTGLSGIKAVRRLADGRTLLRPLLPFSREELRAWLRRGGRRWREDASNADPGIFRNRVRHEWLPWLAAHGRPGVREALARSAEILAAEDELLESLTARTLRRLLGAPPPGTGIRRLNAEELLREPPALRRRVALHWLLEEAGVARPGFETVERLLRLADGTQPPFMLPGHLAARREHRWITARPPGDRTAPAEFDRRLATPGETMIPEAGLKAIAQFRRGIVRETGPVGRLPSAVSLNPDRAAGRPLRLRNRRPGDRIQPLGMEGSRKLQDVFVDAGIPRGQRAAIPVLVCGDEVVWVPGYRVARAWRVRDARRRALRIALAPLSGEETQEGAAAEDGSRAT